MRKVKYGLVQLIIMSLLIALSGCSTDTIETNNEDHEEVLLASVIEVDYSQYFEGMEGTAVFYNNGDGIYYEYNKELAKLPSSPCSSFKIISCLMGLESGVIDPEDAVREWNGINYSIVDWNKDIEYKEAFKTSCIWYYRAVLDDIGKDYVQKTLEALDYGNVDISQWEGTMNNMIFPDLKDIVEINGFWQEASLQISPRQQVDVMRKIFEEKAVFEQKNLDLAKEVMYIDQNSSDHQIYGKTGSGIKDSNWEDAWFVGMIEKDDETIYFAIRLNQPGVRGNKAKEITLNIIQDEFR